MAKTFKDVIAAAGAALLALLMAACSRDAGRSSATAVQTAPEALSSCELLRTAAIPGVVIATADVLAVSERLIQLPAPATLRREADHPSPSRTTDRSGNTPPAHGCDSYARRHDDMA